MAEEKLNQEEEAPKLPENQTTEESTQDSTPVEKKT